ncbi:MAG: amidohydrolase [Clostridia bacterium]|nr:amidohydrolase [Clostridia bacterium]
MFIFDAHAHIFPEKIASKASDNIGAFYDLPMSFDGSIKSLLEVCDRDGISKCLVHSVATKKEQVQSINNFIYESVKQYPERFVGFCSLHPDMSCNEADEELSEAIAKGFYGVKLHPDFQKFNIDDKHALELYEVIDNRLPILFHSGDKRYGFSSPVRLASAVKQFPKQRVIAAHMGGYTEWKEAALCLADFDTVYVDTSSTTAFVTANEFAEYIRAYTPERVLFGTDYPMWRAKDEIEYINRIDLSESDREKIFYKNTCEFLGVEI